jgi:hypothetical protein
MATVYPFRQPADPLQGATANHGPSRFLDQPLSAPHASAPNHTFNLMRGFRCEGLETRLRQCEAAAREKFFQAVEALPDMKLESWFSRQLENEIIPALTRIGFDESFARILFQTAAPSWQRMGPLTNNCIWFDPDLIRNLKAVRDETISKAGSKSDTSWIILPRVYHFLEEEQSAYLLCYLNYLASEATSEFRRILTRVIIEFVGNYALKYRSSMVSGCRMESALFYGYAAMFWRNLRNPPPGFEDDLIFNHCLRWIKLFRSRCADLNDDMAQSIRQMEAYRQKVMLLENAFHSTDNDDPDLGRLLVTLRHGRPGSKAAVDFMGNWLYSSRKDSTGRSLSALLPAALNKLFHTIKIKLPVESPEVQKSLRKFLRGLQENFASNGIDKAGISIKSPDHFRFVVRRVLGVIDGMTASLA